MFEKDEKTGMLKPVWEKPRRTKRIADVASTKKADEVAGGPSLVQRGFAFEEPRGWWWASLDKEVRFTVRQDGRMILCRLPEAWLAARYPGSATGESMLTAARKDFDALTDMAEDLISRGRFQPDRTVLFGAG